MIKDIIIEISNNFLNLSENSVDDIEKSANLIIESIKMEIKLCSVEMADQLLTLNI